MKHLLKQVGLFLMHISPGFFALLNVNRYLPIELSLAIFGGLEALVIVINVAIIKEAKKSARYFAIMAVASLAGIIAEQIIQYPPSTPKELGIAVLILKGVINTGMIAILYGFAAKKKMPQSEKMENR